MKTFGILLISLAFAAGIALNQQDHEPEHSAEYYESLISQSESSVQESDKQKLREYQQFQSTMPQDRATVYSNNILDGIKIAVGPCIRCY